VEKYDQVQRRHPAEYFYGCVPIHAMRPRVIQVQSLGLDSTVNLNSY